MFRTVTRSHHSGGPCRRVGDVSGHPHRGGHLDPGGRQFRSDRGEADPRVAEALAAYQAGQGSEQAALGALAAARLLVPVIAVLVGENSAPAQPGHPAQPADPAQQGDKDSEMVLPTLIGRDGRPAVLAFTGLDALARWRPDARPVPAEADRVWRAAAADGCAVVIDVAGPVPLAVEGARLAALAAQQPVLPPHEDPDVRAAVQAVVAGEPAIASFSLAPGRTGGTDLAVTLHPGPARARETGVAVNRAAAGIAARLGARLRRGIEVVIAE
jgi:SseB protein N-terminal domain